MERETAAAVQSHLTYACVRKSIIYASPTMTHKINSTKIQLQREENPFAVQPIIRTHAIAISLPTHVYVRRNKNPITISLMMATNQIYTLPHDIHQRRETKQHATRTSKAIGKHTLRSELDEKKKTIARKIKQTQRRKKNAIKSAYRKHAIIQARSVKHG